MKKKRLKIYIPGNKYESWITYLEKTSPYSKFHFNFSLWVRNCLNKLPKSDVIPYFPYFPNKGGRNIKQNSANKKIEKTIWIPENMKKALNFKKGYLSLNSFVIMILDLKVFGGINQNQQVFKILNLQKKIDNLEMKLNRIIDESKTKV